MSALAKLLDYIEEAGIFINYEAIDNVNDGTVNN
jgi:hypothetical protein